MNAFDYHEPATVEEACALLGRHDAEATERCEEHEQPEQGLSPQEPLLSAEELRALLQEQPLMPPAAEDV